jgi:hypothetical protein
MKRSVRVGIGFARRPWVAFFAGFILMTALLSVLGSAAGSAHAFEHFVRFHRYINPEGLYYPTASQVAALAREQGDPAETLVIVGGDSLFFGAGQSGQKLWTKVLQDELGPGFRVVNLAFPSGGYQEHGAVAAQALLREGRKVIFVADMFPGYAVYPDGYQYRYVFWDAYYKNLLLHPEERLATVEQSYERSGKTDDLIELKAHHWLDSILHFADFWNYVSYNYFFTVWNQFAAGDSGNFLLPRRLYADPTEQYTPPPFEVRYAPAGRDRELQHYRDVGERGCEHNASGGSVAYEDSGFWAQVRELNRSALPGELRQRTLQVLNYWSPVYRHQLSPADQTCFAEAYARTARALSEAGYHVVVTGADWEDADYHDRIHVTDQGGAKLARAVAPEVRALAAGLGYAGTGRP